MNDILEEAKNARASVVKIEVTPDWTVTRYWDGVAWRDKPNSMYDAMNERNKDPRYRTHGTHIVRLY